MPLRLPGLTVADRARIAVELHLAADQYADCGMPDDAREVRRLARRAHPGKEWRDAEGAVLTRLEDLDG